MAGELVRFGVAMDAELLDRFDQQIERRGYATRSEALRDLVRADLASAHVAEGGLAAGTLTLVYDHHVRELSEKLTEMQHALGEAVVSTLHIHLDHDHCLEVIVMRGPAGVIQAAADRILATKGVENGRLVITAMPSAEHGHHHEHHGAHGHTHDDGDGAHTHSHDEEARHFLAPAAKKPEATKPLEIPSALSTRKRRR